MKTKCPACKFLVPCGNSVKFSADYKNYESRKGTPQKGALAVCPNCSEILVFDSKLHLKKVNLKEFDKLDYKFKVVVLELQQVYKRKKMS